VTTEAKWRALESYVRALAHDLELDAWELRVSREPPEGPDVATGVMRPDAQVFIIAAADVATMHFDSGVFTAAAKDVRVVTLHELLHLHTDHVFSDMMDEYEVTATVREAFAHKQRHTQHYERMVDRLAHAIAPKYPTIRWPEEPDAQENEDDG